jgi:hypothetical protein
MSKKERIILGVGYPMFSRNMVGIRTTAYDLPELNDYDPHLFWCYCVGECECKKWTLVLERDNGKKSK